MRRILISCLIALVSLPGIAAEPIEKVDETQNLVSNLNVPYVPTKLDGQVDNRQTLDIYRPADVKKAPIILYIHGGGWAFGDKQDVNLKPQFFVSKGIAFVSMNYRLRWDYKIYDQLVDIVTVLKWLAVNGEKYALDSSRIILMGHAAGGHLASLIATDSSYLRAENMKGQNIKAVISIDSNSYDIPRLMRELGSFVERRQHELVFTRDESVWKAASPITHVDKSTTLTSFALMYEPNSDASSLQAKSFARALSQAGADVIMIPGAADAPGEIDEQIGKSGHVPTIALMAFIRSQL